MDNQERVWRGTSTRSPGRRLLKAISVVAIVAAAIIALVVWKFVTVQHKADLPDDTELLFDACLFPGVAYVTAAAYEGPAPHPIKLPERPYLGSGLDSGLDLRKLKDLPSAWRPDSAAKVQLIACARRVPAWEDHQEIRQKDCKYARPELQLSGSYPLPTINIPMYQGIYDVTLYELRTHRKVAHTTLIGSDDECPGSFFGKSRDDHVYTRPSASQYVEAFGSYVEK